jgi:hypothetical protein
LLEKSYGRRPLWSSWHRWWVILKCILEKYEQEYVDWTEIAQDSAIKLQFL